jgi:PAS domain S-box-containing protein
LYQSFQLQQEPNILNSTFSQEILDSLGEGVITLDRDFRITFFNRAAEKITGFSRQELIGKFCKRICRSESCLEQCPLGKVLTSGQPVFDLFTRLCQADGSTIQVKMNSAVLYSSAPEPVGGVLSFRELHSLEVLQERLLSRAHFHGIVGQSRGMQEIFHLIEDIAETDATVLIQGESGTGKEMIADAIQARSGRAGKPFIKVNCSVLPEQLLASELFGHVKGAFTDAIRDRQGRFEAAHEGTLFLDEVAEMAPGMQLQLLRVLQQGSFERVGESVTRKVDVRIIAATNKELRRAMANGEFRADLFYRLNVIPIELPPLRERREDIPFLIRHFIDKFSLVYRSAIEDIEDRALDALTVYDWPGNIRELENVIEYAFARSKEDSLIRINKLPSRFREGGYPGEPLQHGERNDDLLQALEKHHWNRSRAAAELGIGRTTLWRRMKELSLV